MNVPLQAWETVHVRSLNLRIGVLIEQGSRIVQVVRITDSHFGLLTEKQVNYNTYPT